MTTTEIIVDMPWMDDCPIIVSARYVPAEPYGLESEGRCQGWEDFTASTETGTLVQLTVMEMDQAERALLEQWKTDQFSPP